MYCIKLDSGMNLVTTAKEPIYRGDNMARKILYLVPTTVGDIDMQEATVYLSYIRADGTADIALLERMEEKYNESYYQYTLPVTSTLTRYAGEVCTFLQIYSGSPRHPVIAKSGECILQVQASKNMDDCARRGLCAWCSVPERAGAKPGWQYRTDFALLHEEFPALVDENGRGWFCRHFHVAMAFARDNPKVVRKAYSETAGELDKKFDAEWRKKVRQFQMPLFSSNADAAWIIRFDDVIADALELGPLRRDEIELPPELWAKIENVRPAKLPNQVIHTLIAYYIANRPEDSDWVVLPVANFDCRFGDTNFGRKYLSQIPEEIIQRSSSFGVSRYRVLPEFLP